MVAVPAVIVACEGFLMLAGSQGSVTLPSSKASAITTHLGATLTCQLNKTYNIPSPYYHMWAFHNLVETLYQ